MRVKNPFGKNNKYGWNVGMHVQKRMPENSELCPKIDHSPFLAMNQF
jgi:hypothetical protein